MPSYVRPLSVAAALLFVITIPKQVLAQDENDSEDLFLLEEVIVTSRKRFDIIREVPIALTVMSGDGIQDKNILKLEELSASIPNIHVAEATIGNQIFIRGVGSGVNQGFEQTVGTYVDGLYLGRGQLSRAPFFDIERIELLKGPQGILFGKNTVAGALSITTSDPESEFAGNVSALYESELEKRNVTGMLTGPIGESIRARVAFKYSGQDGWLDNEAKGNIENDTEEQALRVSLGWDVNEDLEIMLKVASGSYDVKGRANQISTCSAQLKGIFALNGLHDDCSDDDSKWANGSVVSSLDGNSQWDFGEELAETDTQTVSLGAEWVFGEHTLTSITGLVEYDFLDRSDNDNGPLSVLSVERTEDFTQISQELRFASPIEEPFEYLIGIYWQDSELVSTMDAHVALYEVPDPRLPPTSFAGTRASNFDQDASTWSVYAQGMWNISDQWIATLGLRYGKEEKDVSKVQTLGELGLRTNVDPASPLAPVINGVFNGLLNSFAHDLDRSRDESNFAPSANIQWVPSDDARIYMSISKGFKGGGFDAVLANGDPDLFEYDKEEVIAFELGSKLRLFEGAGSLNIAIFRSEFSDVQISTFDGALGFLVTNAGEIVTQGLEVDGLYRVNEILTIGGAAAYLDSQYDKFPDAQCYSGQTEAQGCINGFQDLAGGETQFSPDISLSLHAEVVYPVFDQMEVSGFLEIVHIDDYAIANDLDPNMYQDAFTKVNLRLALSASNDAGWEVAFVGKNLTDKKTTTWGNDVPLFAGSYYIHNDPPRTLAVQGSYRF